MKSWHEYFIDIAEGVSTKSKDRSTKVGAIIVGPNKEVRTTGFNGFPRGVDDDVEERHERPTKYIYTAHAEENCISNAAMVGVSLLDCVMYLNWEPTAVCSRCARAVINSGLVAIIGPNKQFPSKNKDWQEDFKHSTLMLNERGVKQYVYDTSSGTLKEVT